MPHHSEGSRSRTLIYVQIAHHLRERILEGKYPANSLLPSERELAHEWKASRQTIRLALEQLRQEQMISSEQGRGNRVLPIETEFSSVAEEDVFSPKLAALVIYDVTHGGAMAICQGAAAAMQVEGYHLIVAETASQSIRRAEDEAQQIRSLIDKGIRGLIIYAEPTDMNRALLEEALSKGIQVVQIDRYLNGLECDHVGVENAPAAAEVTEHLLELGHKRIAFLSFQLAASTCQERLQGYITTLRRNGLPIDADLIGYCDANKEHTEELPNILKKWLTLPEPPTAIFTVNDELAFDVLQILSTFQVGVPNQIAIVGFDNLPAAGLVSPPITTIAQPFHDLGYTAAQLLLSRMQRKFVGHPRRVLLPTRLVVRQSCGALTAIPQSITA